MKDEITIAAHEAEWKTILVPYSCVNGKWTLSDTNIGVLYRRAKVERLLELVLYDRDVENLTESSFVEFYKQQNRNLWLIFYERRLAGWVWLDAVHKRTARVHFSFFRWLSRNRVTARVARETLWHLLNKKFANHSSLRVIRGETPAFNKPAVRFLHRIGMNVIGEIPYSAHRHSNGVAYPMVYSFITKDMLEQYIAEYYPPEQDVRDRTERVFDALETATF